MATHKCSNCKLVYTTFRGLNCPDCKSTAMLTDKRKRHHQCGGADGQSWLICTACQGRMHLEGCTSRRNPAKDCCLARHKQLYDAGQTVGIDDSSQPMWEPQSTVAPNQHHTDLAEYSAHAKDSPVAALKTVKNQILWLEYVSDSHYSESDKQRVLDACQRFYGSVRPLTRKYID